MNIYENAPYTYFMMWKQSGIKYYGSQYGKNSAPINVLSGRYRTSSKYVKEYWKTYGPPDVIVIHKVFENVSDCRDFEHLYLKRLRVTKRVDWLNKTDNKSIAPECGGSPQSVIASHKSRKQHMEECPEFREYMAIKANTNLNSENAMVKRRNTFKESKHSQGERNLRFGVTVKGTETAKRISDARKLQKEFNIARATELNSIRRTCEHCGKDGLSAGNYKRWHHDRCRLLSISE